jgi:hypothetical protein
MVLDFLDMMLLPRAVVYEEVLSYHELSSTKSYRLPRAIVYQEPTKNLSTKNFRRIVAHVCMSVLVSWLRCYIQKWKAGDVRGSYEGQVTRCESGDSRM